MLWAEMESVIMQISDITADMFDANTPLDAITPLLPSASLDVIAILSISNKFSQLTRSFVQLLSDNEPVQWRQCNQRRWAGSKRTQEQQQQRHMIADIVRRESNIMLEQLQALRDFVSQHGYMYAQQKEKYRKTAEVWRTIPNMACGFWLISPRALGLLCLLVNSTFAHISCKQSG